MTTSKSKKEFPISEFYPEIYEYVPKIFEKQSAEISFGTFEENIETPTDEKIPLTIQKSIRYNGAKNYNGGDINYFNGTIKADGKFNFEGGGSRAKIEVIAVDLDGSLSFKQTRKDKPPFIYVENSDFVSQMTDEIKFSVENDFEEIINLKDCDGDLTISRRRKFDGYLSYRGDDSVDITDVKNLIKGGVYIITDGETSKEVQIKENLGTIENGYRILFAEDVAKYFYVHRKYFY